jgi:hypothetical protein
MEELPKYYTALLAASDKALEALDSFRFAAARNFLIQGQLEAEALYMEDQPISKP